MNSLDRRLWGLYWVFVATKTGFGVMAFFTLWNARPVPPDDLLPILGAALGVAATGLGGASLFIREYLIRRPLAEGTLDVTREEDQVRLSVRFLILWGLADLVAVVGLFFAFFTQSFVLFVPFLTGALFLMLRHAPRIPSSGGTPPPAPR